MGDRSPAAALSRADAWHVGRAARATCTSLVDGVLGSLDLAQVAAALPDGGTGAPVDPATGKPAEERFSVRVRVVVTAHGGAGDGLQGIRQKQVFVHDDPDLVSGLPARVAGRRHVAARCSRTSTANRATS